MSSLTGIDAAQMERKAAWRSWGGAIDGWLSQNRNFGLAIVAIAFLQIVLIVTHQPWLDEWQSLQIALQSPDFAGLMNNLAYEGHPPLWYLLIRLFGLVLPYAWVLPALLIPIAAITHWAILARAPFPRLERLMLCAGELILFEYMTISRSLSLGVMLIFLAAALWKSRAVWIPIILLPMCDFQFGLFSLAMVALLFRERRLDVAGFVVWGISGCLAAWSVLPAPDVVPAITQRDFALDTVVFIERFGANFFPFQMHSAILKYDTHALAWNGMPPFRTGLLLGPLFVWFGFKQLQSDRLSAAIFIGFVVICFVFNTLVYPLQTRHLMLAAILLIFLKWQLQPNIQSRDSVFAGWLSVSMLASIAVMVISAMMPFHSSANAYAKIKELHLTDKHWASFPESRGQGISALSGMKFQRLQQNCMQQFVRWNYEGTLKGWDDLEAELRSQIAVHGKFYLLTDFRMKLPSDIARQRAKITKGYDGQSFYITEIGPHEKEHAVKLPDCVPGQRPLSAARL